MGTQETDPFDSIASAIIALHAGGGDATEQGFDPGPLPDAFGIDPPTDVYASNIPEVAFERAWQLGDRAGVVKCVLRRSSAKVDLLWRVEPFAADVRFWVEFSCRESDVRPSWFLLGAPCDDKTENEFSVSAKVLGIDVIGKRVNVRIVPE